MLMEFPGSVCRKECKIFQYLHVGIPQNFHVAYIGMLYVEISMFFAVIFPINNTFTLVGFLTFNFNLWQNGRRQYIIKWVICTIKNRIAQILGARWLMWLNFVFRLLISVGLRYGTCFTHPSGAYNFEVGPGFLENLRVCTLGPRLEMASVWCTVGSKQSVTPEIPWMLEVLLSLLNLFELHFVL
jgi:hypothetical protein